MNFRFHRFISVTFLTVTLTHGQAQTTLIALAANNATSNHFHHYRSDEVEKPGDPIGPAMNSENLTRYEQSCIHRFFDFCDYLLTPPDIVIDSATWSGGGKKEEVVMQRERAADTARIKKAVLRYTVVPEPTNTGDSLHFSEGEMSDGEYRRLEIAFSKMEKLLDTCYNAGGVPLSLLPFRLHSDSLIRAQLGPERLSSTFLLCRGKQILAVLLFTPRDRMTAATPPRICGWSVDFRQGQMIFHNLAGSDLPLVSSARSR